MDEIAERMRQRLEATGLSQKVIAERAGISTQRLGNYIQGTRTPDIFIFAKIAKALETSTDWLLGMPSVIEEAYNPVVTRLLQLEGLPPERAELIVETAQEAVRLLLSLPPGGNDRDRSQMAAQLAWQAKASPTPH